MICSCVGWMDSGVQVFTSSGKFQRAGDDFEKMQRAEIFKQFGDARVGIQQFYAALAGRAGRVQFQAELRQDSEKRAVHQHALRQINDEMRVAFFRQFRQQRLEIRAGNKIGAPGDFDAGEIIAHQHF